MRFTKDNIPWPYIWVFAILMVFPVAVIIGPRHYDTKFRAGVLENADDLIDVRVVDSHMWSTVIEAPDGERVELGDVDHPQRFGSAGDRFKMRRSVLHKAGLEY